jgi:Tripartite ATP-independent periplasmic transporters, DctQ component
VAEKVLGETEVARKLAGSPSPRRRNAMDRFIDGIELVAAFFVGIVAADIFISVLLRYFFAIQIPDAYDFGRLLLGILIFWGIAATSYRGTHITVDLVWSNVGPRWQRVIDVFATLVLLFVVTVQTLHAVRQGHEHLQGQCSHVRSKTAHVAVFPGRLDRRRVGGDADRGAHLSADLPPRIDG